MNHCFMSCIHRALKSAAPSCTDSPVPVPQAQRRIPTGEGFEKRKYDESPEFALQLPQILYWSLTASKALSHGLNFKSFLGEHAPQTPLQDCTYMLYIRSRFGATYCKRRICEGPGTRLARARTTASYARRTNPYSRYAPPHPPFFTESLYPPLHSTLSHHSMHWITGLDCWTGL